MKDKKIKVPVSATRDSSGATTYEYQEISLAAYEQWLKRIYEISGTH